MVSIVDTAFVQILPKLDRFEPELKAGVNRAFVNLDQQATRATTQVDEKFRRMGTSVSESFVKIDPAAAKAFTGVQQHATKSGLIVAEDWKKTTTKVDTQFVKMRTEADAQLNRVQRKSRETSEGTARGFSSMGSRLVATAAVIGGVEFFRHIIEEGRTAIQVGRQTETVIETTGGAAHVTAAQVEEYAVTLGHQIGVQNDVVQSGENILLTFTAVRNEVGKGNDIFNQAETAAVDMTAALNHGAVSTDTLQKANIQLGKALNDPIKGITALQRVGVSFTSQQRTQIKALVESGNTLQAQKLILAELKTEFGGVAAASATDSKRFRASLGDLEEELGKLFIPILDSAAKRAGELFGFLDEHKTLFKVMAITVGGLTGAFLLLTVALKAHEVVTEAAEVFTGGLNKALGRQAVITPTVAAETEGLAVAETGLATSSTAAATGTTGLGVAAGGAATGLAAMATKLGLVGLAIVAVGDVVYAATSKTQSYTKTVEDQTAAQHRYGAVLGGALYTSNRAVEATQHKTKVTQDDTRSTKEAGLTEAQLTKIHQQNAANVAALTRANDAAKAAIDKVTTSLTQATGELQKNRDSIAQSIESYQGLITKSDVTAKQVIGDLHNQVRNFRTYSHDVQDLIRRGVDPAAIQELSVKGPQFVHALERGSNAQLIQFRQDWAARNKEIRGNFADSVDLQYATLKRAIERMQNEINRLSGKTIFITAKASVQIDKSVRMYLAAANVPGFHHEGYRVPGYGGGDRHPALLEGGETVVSKESSKLPYMQEAFMAAGVPGYQLGGLAGPSYRAGTVAETRRIGISEAKVAAAVFGRIMAAPGTSGNVGAVSQWTANVLHEPGSAAAWGRRIMFESGGHWDAVNRTDRNWFAGHPSVGGAQVIRGTFNTYANGFRGVGPFLYGVSINPYANSYAGGNYAQHRYGSLAAVDPLRRPIGYDSGVGVMPPGLSVWENRTGRPEPMYASPVIDHQLLGETVAHAVVRGLKAAGVGAVYLDGRRVDRQLDRGRISNARYR